MERKDKDKVIEEGMAMFLIEDIPRQPQDVFYLYDMLPNKYKNNIHAMDVLEMRNMMILLSTMEIFSAMWGFSYYFIRRSVVYIVVNSTAFGLSIIGVCSIIFMFEIGLIFYTLITTALPGAFFFYQIFEYFALRNTAEGDSRRLNDNILIGVFSLPYLYDFFCGIMAVIFISRIAKFNEVMKRLNQDMDDVEAKKLLEEIKQKYSDDHLIEEFERRNKLKREGESGSISNLYADRDYLYCIYNISGYALYVVRSIERY